MWKWPVIATMLLACGVGEPDAPMLGDCANCGTAPVSGGSSSGGSDATIDANNDGGDAGNEQDATLDGLDIVDVGVNPDAGNNPDAIDIVDVGVPNP